MSEKPLRTLIVDDEPVARDILREELETIAGVQVVGEADNGLAALELITSERPDMVLLDLQMPAMGGLDLVRRLTPETSFPAIVIVTAWDQYAIRAFDAGAIDYLLKPVSCERLLQAVEKVRRTTSRQTLERVVQLQEIAVSRDELPARKIIARAGAEYILLAASEVYAFQAEGDLVWILTAKSKYLATQTLKTLEERLRNSSFRRIHRGALVNLDHVRKMSTLSSQRWLVTLNNRAEFIVSKRQASGIRQLLSW
ncbi:MAG: response regulator receiver protein [Bryobacterales bacterium]|nr:response regulator receiver protein [Bryobacterales bacterium]